MQALRLLAALAIAAAAQLPSSSAFEVASIKPNHSGRGAAAMGTQPGRYTATNATLRTLIVNAYGLQTFQLSGGPRWIGTDHFDIVAAIPADAPPDASGMLRTLLAERFKLVMHHESRDMPMYALITARNDKQLGPRIHPAAADCDAADAQSTMKEKDTKGKTKQERGGAAPAPAARRARPPCRIVIGPGRMSAGAMTMATLAASLSRAVRRTVVDRTTVSGTFDMELTWTPDQMPQRPAGDTSRKGQKIDPNGPSIFTALKEQLGLKLESTKTRGPVDVLVIDRAERPIEN